jgi:hypothetical protein
MVKIMELILEGQALLGQLMKIMSLQLVLDLRDI